MYENEIRDKKDDKSKAREEDEEGKEEDEEERGREEENEGEDDDRDGEEDDEGWGVAPVPSPPSRIRFRLRGGWPGPGHGQEVAGLPRKDSHGSACDGWMEGRKVGAGAPQPHP